MGLSDIFLGSKSKTIKPDAITYDIRNTQKKGLGELNSALDTSAEQSINQQADIQRRGILTTAQDARRNAQKLMAQRGLSGSSLGLSSQRSIDQQTGRDISAVNAAIPGQIRNQAIQDATTRIGAGNINTTGMNFNTIQGSRSGGVMGIASALAPIAGTVIGGMYGGPAGAAAGGKIGAGLGGALQSQQNPNQGAYSPNSYSMGNYQF